MGLGSSGLCWNCRWQAALDIDCHVFSACRAGCQPIGTGPARDRPLLGFKGIGPAAKVAEKTLRDLQSMPMPDRPELKKEANEAMWAALQGAVKEALEVIGGK